MMSLQRYRQTTSEEVWVILYNGEIVSFMKACQREDITPEKVVDIVMTCRRIDKGLSYLISAIEYRYKVKPLTGAKAKKKYPELFI
jgi:hypothetical protein